MSQSHDPRRRIAVLSVFILIQSASRDLFRVFKTYCELAWSRAKGCRSVVIHRAITIHHH